MTLARSRTYARRVGIVISLFALSSLAAPRAPAVEVYQDEHVTIRAMVAGLEGRIIHFGDVLSLVMEVVPHSSGIQLQELDGAYFTNAWPKNSGIYLLAHRTYSGSRPGSSAVASRIAFDFQILDCPDGEALCRGTRRYELPEFTLRYHIVDEGGEITGTEVVKFRPWPDELMVSSALPLGKNDALFSFTTYFPVGAYPEGLSGREGHVVLGLIAGGLVASLGGVLLLPLKFGRISRFRVKPVPRWQRLLEQLRAGEVEGEQRYFDALRRCLVWYCVDELAVDPFDWLERREEASGTIKEELSAHRSLFLDILHQRHEGREVLLDRLSSLTPGENHK